MTMDGPRTPGRTSRPLELDSSAPAPRALYLHFPFCAHRCHYCDFSVKRAASPPVQTWIDRIETEVRWWFATANWVAPTRLDTVFLGGGTPSLLGGAGLQALRERLDPWFVIDPDETEWTVEANPASFDAGLASAWRRAGVNRVSLGVQAFDDDVLRWLGRLHDRSAARSAIVAARESGFERLSVDLIFGLPDEVQRDLDRELDELLALEVPHVSLYGLTVEPRTPLADWVRRGRVAPPSEDRFATEYRLLASRLREAGYDHYEVSNFAKPGQQGRHNWFYWNRSPYLGVGPSAHGFLPPYRTWNVFRWDRYERALRGGHGPVEGWERVGEEERLLEQIWLGLRTVEGLPRSGAERRSRDQRIDRWAQEGWLEQRGDRWVATVEGWLRMDSMVAELATER